MKKLAVILLTLLLLTGCGKNKQICGEVVSVTNGGQYVQLVLRTEDDRQTRVLADGHTFVYSFAGIEEGLLSGKLLRPVVTAYELRKQDGAWLAERICVESIQLPDGYTLKDGTVLTVRKNYSHTIYSAADGIEILREQNPIGPDNISVGGLPSFSDLKAEVQEKIMAYYDALGLLYDLDDELEKAYRDFLSLDNPISFQSRLLSQDICPSAANEKLVWYSVYVTRPVEGGLHHQTSTHTVFDRETGAVIDPASLFLCSEAEAARVILDVSGMPDTELRHEMEKAFRFDYLNFHSNALDICFPAGSLPSQNTDHLLGVEYEDLSGIIHPWAVPDSDE